MTQEETQMGNLDDISLKEYLDDVLRRVDWALHSEHLAYDLVSAIEDLDPLTAKFVLGKLASAYAKLQRSAQLLAEAKDLSATLAVPQ